MVNLLGNAIKFTPTGGSITIEADIKSESPDDITLLFSVQDTGIGIPAHKQHRIFDAFSQADNSVTRHYGGTGLGLSISAQLAQLMQGKMWFKSEEGVGSTFFFTAVFDLRSEEAIQEVPF